MQFKLTQVGEILFLKPVSIGTLLEIISKPTFTTEDNKVKVLVLCIYG